MQLLKHKTSSKKVTQRNGDTALIRASEKGDLDIVELLIEKGSNPETQNEYELDDY